MSLTDSTHGFLPGSRNHCRDLLNCQCCVVFTGFVVTDFFFLMSPYVFHCCSVLFSIVLFYFIIKYQKQKPSWHMNCGKALKFICVNSPQNKIKQCDINQKQTPYAFHFQLGGLLLLLAFVASFLQESITNEGLALSRKAD